MKITKAIGSLLIGFAALNSHAQQIEVTVTNLTQGIYYTPFVIAAHDSNFHIFQSGEVATPELQAQAEGGSITGVVDLAMAANAVVDKNLAGGLLAPAASATTVLDTGVNQYLSLTAMLLPTNDGFVGLDAWKIPEVAGTYIINLNAYDAGTEANDEIVNGGGPSGVPGIPAAPGMKAGVNGTGVTDTETNQNIHIHRGSLGDDDLTGGKSDLDNRIHRWLNPVVKLRVVVQ
jgi:hypothetical protein